MSRMKTLRQRRRSNRERLRTWRERLREKGGKETTIVLDKERADMLEELVNAFEKSQNKVIMYALAVLYIQTKEQYPHKFNKDDKVADLGEHKEITCDDHA